MTLNTEVSTIRETNKGVEIRTSNGETIVAAKAIITSGPWIKGLLSDTLQPILKTLLQTQYWFDIDSAYHEQLTPNKMPVFLCGDEKAETTRSFYGFPMFSGQSNGMKFAVHESDKEVEPNEKDSVLPVTSAEDIYAFISRYVRGLKSKALRSVNCLYTMTPDENFIIDFMPDSKRIIFASACSGHGFKHSAAIGEVLNEMATKGTSRLDVQEFRLKRFRK